MHPLLHESKLPLYPLCHESKLPCIHCSMNPNCHASIVPSIQTAIHPCTVGAQFRTNRTYKLFSASTSMHVHGKSAVITMPLRTENTHNHFYFTCLLILASHQYENACDLKSVYFYETDMNTEYMHIASYQYEAERIRNIF